MKQSGAHPFSAMKIDHELIAHPLEEGKKT